MQGDSDIPSRGGHPSLADSHLALVTCSRLAGVWDVGSIRIYEQQQQGQRRLYHRIARVEGRSSAIIMSTRYAAANNRSQLSSLLAASGYSGDVPSVTNSAEHNLLAWMANCLRPEHLMPEAEAATLSQQLMELPLEAKGNADVLLGHFSELPTNDLSAMQDQDSVGMGALSSAWLEDETLEDLDGRLLELAEERCMYKKQMLVRLASPRRSFGQGVDDRGLESM